MQIKEVHVAAIYTFDIFSTLDGFGSCDERGDWGGYWGKQGPEFLDHRLEAYSEDQRMVFGAKTFREFVEMMKVSDDESGVRDQWVARMKNLPATVISSTLQEPVDWPNATIVNGDAVDIITKLKNASALPLRSHGSLSLNKALLAAGLVDRIQVTIFPVISGQSGTMPVFKDVADLDLKLIENRTFDDNIQELIYVPTLHHR
jgi:dihydrofolate reductase